jgi:hypothetical protein
MHGRSAPVEKGEARRCASRLLKYLRQQFFSGLMTQPWMAAPTKQARQRLIRRERVRTCAGLAI